MARRAIAAGRMHKQSRMSRPLSVQGVGNGAPTASWQSDLPIAITHAEGDVKEHRYTAPTLEGAGADLPALLGLQTISGHRGVLEIKPGKERLTFPGLGGYEIQSAPGALHMPLERPPNGHLSIPCNDFASIVSTTGGLPPRTLQLHATQVTEVNNVEAVSGNQDNENVAFAPGASS